MKFLFGLALKNLARYRRRTLITAFAIAIGLAMFIWVDSMLTGLDDETIRNIRFYETGSGKIVNSDYREEMDRGRLDHLITDPGKLSDILTEESIPHTRRVNFTAEAVVDEGSLFVRATGIDPETDDQVYRFRDSLAEGEYLRSGEHGALLGKGVARSLNVGIGEFITLRCKTASGFNQSMELQVAGVLNTPNVYANNSSLLLPLDVADEILFLDGAVTEISYRTSILSGEGFGTAELLNARLAEVAPDHVAVPWEELAESFLTLADAKSQSTGMILFFVFIIAAVGISNTMLMAIYERVQEIGMMRALGMKNRQIRIAFLLESAGIGLIGSICGVVIGSLLTFQLVTWGIDVTEMLGDMEAGYRTAGIMYGSWNITTIVTAFFAGIVLAVVVAIVPTRHAIKLKIVDALRHN